MRYHWKIPGWGGGSFGESTQDNSLSKGTTYIDLLGYTILDSFGNIYPSNAALAQSTKPSLGTVTNRYYGLFLNNFVVPAGGIGGGVVLSNTQGQVYSGQVDLGSNVTGTLSPGNGGTGQKEYTTGDILYANATNTLARMGIGSSGQVLVVSSGVPSWTTIGSSSCPTCVITNPSSTQTITPTSATAIGLSIAQASGGSVDIFNVTNNAGSTEYLSVDSSGRVIFNGGTNVGIGTTAPAAALQVVGSTNIGENSATTGNPTLTIFGYDSGASAVRSATMQIATNGSFNITGPTGDYFVLESSSRLALNHNANSLISMFEGAASGENRTLEIYGFDTAAATAKAGTLSVNSSGTFALAAPSSEDISLTPGAATNLVNILTGNLKVGNGTPTLTQDGEDGYIEGTFEVDGISTFGSNVGIGGDTTPDSLLEVGDGTDEFQVDADGDLVFVDANSGASITGPAGGALTIASGASQAITLDAATSVNIDGDTSIIFQDGGTTYTTITQSGTQDLLIAPTGGDALITGTLDVSGHGAFGGGASVDSTRVLNVAETITATSSQQWAVIGLLTANPSGDSTAEYRAVQGLTTSSGSSQNFTGGYLTGVLAEGRHAGSGTATNAYGVLAFASKQSTGVLAQANAIYAQVNNTNATGAITLAYGIEIANGTATGAITTNYGLFIQPLTAGGSDYGARIDAADTQTLWLSGNADNTTAAAGIAFGSSRDTNLYRSAANTLTTDDAFVTASTLDIGSIPATGVFTAALCWDNSGASQVQDCVGSVSADYAEIYPVSKDVGYGEIVTASGDLVEISVTETDQAGNPLAAEKKKVSRLTKSAKAYDAKIIGITSKNYGDFSSVGHNSVKKSDNPMPVALAGRVPVKVSAENGPIEPGDYLTSSSTPGVAMKSTRPGQVIGKALESYSGGEVGKILVFVNVGYADPGEFLANLNWVIDGNGNLLTQPIPLDPAGIASITGNQLSSHTSEGKDKISQNDPPEGGEQIATNSASPDSQNDVLNEINTLSTKVDELQKKISSLFRGLTEFLGNVIFHGQVTFLTSPVFNSDTAGIAVIKKGSDLVDIVFDREYPDSPLVNAQIVLDKVGDSEEEKKALGDLEEGIFNGGVKSLITNRSAKGFTIKLNKKAPVDLQFSWTALAVKDMKRVVGKIEATPSASVAPPQLPEASESASPSAIFIPEEKEDNPPKIKVLENGLGFLRVREGPNIDSQEVGQVKPNETFLILDSQYGFYRIEYKEGEFGWVSSTYTVKE